MQNVSVDTISSEAGMFSKQNPKNLQRGLTPRCPPSLSGKRNQMKFQYVKPTAKRETQPRLDHIPESARTNENTEENVQEEITSHLASGLQLLNHIPSRIPPSTTRCSGTESNKAQSLSAVVPHCTTQQLPCLPLKSASLAEAYLAERKTRHKN